MARTAAECRRQAGVQTGPPPCAPGVSHWHTHRRPCTHMSVPGGGTAAATGGASSARAAGLALLATPPEGDQRTPRRPEPCSLHPLMMGPQSQGRPPREGERLRAGHRAASGFSRWGSLWGPDDALRGLQGRAPAARAGLPLLRGCTPAPPQPTCRTGRVALADRLHQPQVPAGDRRRLCRGLGLLPGPWELLQLVLLLPLAVVAQDAVGRLHDHVGVKALSRHGQELVVVFTRIPGVAGVALKLLEGADSLGLHGRGGHLGRGLEQAARQRQSVDPRSPKAPPQSGGSPR